VHAGFPHLDRTVGDQPSCVGSPAAVFVVYERPPRVVGVLDVEVR